MRFELNFMAYATPFHLIDNLLANKISTILNLFTQSVWPLVVIKSRYSGQKSLRKKSLLLVKYQDM